MSRRRSKKILLEQKRIKNINKHSRDLSKIIQFEIQTRLDETANRRIINGETVTFVVYHSVTSMAERRVTFSIGQRAVRIVANRDSANKSLLLKVHAPSFPPSFPTLTQ